MNKQDKGNGSRGIEWCTHTWNPIGGCEHGCRWTMPDGNTAICYAESVALGVARETYPRGFAHHYWHPERLQEPLALKEPARIFLDSMSDLMGHWIPDDQVRGVLDICRQASWHTFQCLTKSPKRLLKFDFPRNVWLGVSMPPDVMMGQKLNEHHKARYMDVTCDVLQELHGRGHTTFISFEPLSWDVAPFVDVAALSWAIIGAASRGATYYQPDADHLAALLGLLKSAHVPIFMKGNLRPSIPDGLWLEQYPQPVTAATTAKQLGLFG